MLALSPSNHSLSSAVHPNVGRRSESLVCGLRFGSSRATHNALVSRRGRAGFRGLLRQSIRVSRCSRMHAKPGLMRNRPAGVIRLGCTVLRRLAAQALDQAREVVAAAVGARPDEVVFTASAAHSNHAAIAGFALGRRRRRLAHRQRRPSTTRRCWQRARGAGSHTAVGSRSPEATSTWSGGPPRSARPARPRHASRSPTMRSARCSHS